MHLPATTTRLLACAILYCSMAFAQNPAQPAADLSPEEVVRAQLVAMQANDQPYADAGIGTTRRFASPGNKQMVGSLENFQTMLHEQYPELLNHRSHQIVSITTQGLEAWVNTVVVARNGSTYHYRFYLSRWTTDDCERCWLTDGVEVGLLGQSV